MSLQKAVKQNCKDCIYDPSEAGTWLQQVTNCTVVKCALYEYRPLDKATKDKIKKAKIAAMTPEELAAYQEKVEMARERMLKMQS